MAEKKVEQKEAKETEDPRSLYEVGFYVAPTVREEEATAELGDIIGYVEKKGGIMKSSQTPQLRSFSYEIEKIFSGKKRIFSEGYFGSAVFLIDRSETLDIEKHLKAMKNVLRYILIKIPKEALLPRERKIPISHREDVRKKISEEKIPLKTAPTMTEEELDKTIEELVVE